MTIPFSCLPTVPKYCRCTPGVLFPCLHETGFIDDADGMGMGMLLGDDLLQAVAGQIFLPTMLAEELLQRSHGHVGRQGDRLDALAGQVRKLTVHIDRQMRPRVLAVQSSRRSVSENGQASAAIRESVGHPCLGLLDWAGRQFRQFTQTRQYQLSAVVLIGCRFLLGIRRVENEFPEANVECLWSVGRPDPAHVTATNG